MLVIDDRINLSVCRPLVASGSIRMSAQDNVNDLWFTMLVYVIRYIVSVSLPFILQVPREPDELITVQKSSPLSVQSIMLNC